MIERRKTPRKDWVIGKDEVGRAVLQWKVDSHHARRQERDPLARTYDFLERLEAPDLSLEDDAPARATRGSGFNPYDRGAPVSRKHRDDD